jgi:hypothetical protein
MAVLTFEQAVQIPNWCTHLVDDYTFPFKCSLEKSDSWAMIWMPTSAIPNYRSQRRWLGQRHQTARYDIRAKFVVVHWILRIFILHLFHMTTSDPLPHKYVGTFRDTRISIQWVFVEPKRSCGLCTLLRSTAVLAAVL